MATCAQLVNGYVSPTSDPVEQCSGYVLISPSEYSMNYQYVEIAAEEVSAAFAGAFALVLIPAAAAWKFKVAKASLKQI